MSSRRSTLAGIAAVAALGLAVGLVLTDAATGPSPCEAALAAADDMAVASAEVGRSLDRAEAGESVDIDGLYTDWHTAYDAYETARAECGGDR